SGLPCHGGCPALVGPAKAVHADAAAKIDVFFPLAVHTGRVFTADKNSVKAAVGRHKTGFIQLLDFFRSHETSLPFSTASSRCLHPSEARLEWSAQCGRR